MINTDLVKQGVAVKCNCEEEAKELFEAMGWRADVLETNDWIYFWEDMGDIDGWQACDIEEHTEGRRIVCFSDLKQSRLASVLGVKDGERFTYCDDNIVYILDDYVKFTDTGRGIGSPFLCNMINNPDKIKPIKKYSQETIEAAKAAKILGFYFVKCYLKGYIELDTDEDRNQGKRADIYPKNGAFQDLEKGKVYKLNDIIDNE